MSYQVQTPRNAMSRDQVEKLILRAEEQHTHYLSTLRELLDHNTTLNQNAPEPLVHGKLQSPQLRPVQVPPITTQEVHFRQPLASRRRRRSTNDFPDRRPFGLHKAASVHSLDLDTSDEDNDDGDSHIPPRSVASSTRAPDDRICVQKPLRGHSYRDDDLLTHIRNTEFPSATQIILDDVYSRRSELNKVNLFSFFNDRHDQLYEYATYEVFETGLNGIAQQKHLEADNDENLILDAGRVWDTISHANDDGLAVGRVTSLLDPSPLMLAGLHLTLKGHFDMDELFSHLVTNEGNKGKTKAYMNRAFEQHEVRQRSFFFVFKYYTVVGDKNTPAPWQTYDNRPTNKSSEDHIDICECSSILALSLAGKHVDTIERRRRSKSEAGKIYDTFAPWQLLNIQCFPDDEHIMRNDDARSYCNGPYAFLDSLVIEYRDAVKRNLALNARIAKLIHPPDRFMFDRGIRDELLFEDQHFTYSRRYFWAYNTLGVINEGIAEMIAAYEATFTPDFWAGNQVTLFPFPRHGTPEFHLYLEALAPLRRALDEAIAGLKRARKKNTDTRHEIKVLREQLFSGSSVKESRRAIEQGDNIKVLTSVSMIFLPLTFVTSVWSMTGFPLDVDDWQFPITMILACVPFILFVCLLLTQTGMETFKRFLNWVDGKIHQYSQRRAAKQDVPPSSSIHASHLPATVAAIRPPPRRKRKFSLSDNSRKSVEEKPNPRPIWPWIRRAHALGNPSPI
jgi:hypothetical protein